MIGLGLIGGAKRVLCVGAHPDDIEIGCGGLLLTLAGRPGASVDAVVLTGTEDRADEARDAARRFSPTGSIEVLGLPDGRLPEHWGSVKRALHECRDRLPAPDVVLAPRAADRHQDHALLGALVPTVWRDAMVLSYEIPKWDGDVAHPNVYVPLEDEVARRKVALLNAAFPSQHSHDWWDDEVFLGLMRLRGMECRVRYAEAFELAKATLTL